MMRGRRGVAARVLMPVVGVFAALVVAAADLGAQTGGVWSGDSHTCGDCHGSHDAGPGMSGLVREGRSDLAPQAPGIGPVSERCLLCHGTAGDRLRAESDRPLGRGAGLLLGGSLSDDHPMGVVVVDGLGLDFPDPGFPESNAPNATPGFESGNSIECAACHDPHDPWLATRQTQLQDDTCLACHAPEYDVSAHGVANCGSCHRVHSAPRTQGLMREPSNDYLCGACHSGAPSPLHVGIDPIPGSPLHDEPSDFRCEGCHRIH